MGLFKREKPDKPHASNDAFIKPTVQTKLKVGKADDRYEKEADQVADKVVNANHTADNIRKKGSEEEMQQKPIASSVSPLLQKTETTKKEAPVQKMEEEEEAVQQKGQEEEEAVQQKGEEEEEAVQQKGEEEEETVQQKGEEEEEAVQQKGEEEEETVQQKGEQEEEAVQQKGQEEEEAVQQKGEEEEETVQQKGEEEETVQQKAATKSTPRSKPIEGRLNRTKGKGTPLTGRTKREMEKGFGADFSHVNIHTDDKAVEMSQDIGAQAFTHGNDIYFNRGKYDPSSSKGKHLLAHELTHTIQQKGMVRKKIQRKDLVSYRFKENPRLEKILDRKLLAGIGSGGSHIRIIQQALLDAGFSLPKYGVDGVFGNETKAAVKAFQVARKLPKKEQDGVVGPLTMEELDKHYTGYKTEHQQFAGDTVADINKGTRTLTSGEIKDVKEAMSTEVKADPITGKEPVFDPKNSSKYKKELKESTEKIALWQYDKLGKGKQALRSDPDNLHDTNDIDNLAKVSKRETDKVFGGLKKGPPLKFGKNIFDGWQKKQNSLKGKSAMEQSMIKTGWARWRIQKIVEGPSMAKINEKYGAIQSRDPEQIIVQQIITELSIKYRKEMVQTHLGWAGFADEGKIFLQRFKSGDSEKNRDFMWKNFGTIIHEYLHTLEHQRSKKHHEAMPEKKGGKVLREGVTDYFTKIVWNNLHFGNQPFRKEVEGPFYDKTKKNTPDIDYYAEAKNAERIAGIVGVNNLMASFFLGKVELIGKR